MPVYTCNFCHTQPVLNRTRKLAAISALICHWDIAGGLNMFKSDTILLDFLKKVQR